MTLPSAHPTKEDPLLTTAEAAEYLRVTKNTLHNWQSLGTGPDRVFVRRKRLYRFSALERFIEESTNKQNSRKLKR